MDPAKGERPHENVLRIETRVRNWNGVTVVDVQEYTRGEVLHPLLNDDETGIAVALNEVGGVTEPRIRPDIACTLDHRPNHMTLVPRGMELWGHATKELHYSRYALLLFDLSKLQQNFQDEFRPEMFERPRMRFTDTRIHSLVKMLVEMPPDDASTALLGDSLTAAVFALLSTGEAEPPKRGRLSDRQLVLVTDYLRDQLAERIELDKLAALTDTSQWHLSRAFRAATGLSLHQWQFERRLELAQDLLAKGNLPLEAVAVAAGFSDEMQLRRALIKRFGRSAF